MLSETVTTITQNDVLPTIVNQVSNSTIWLARLFGELVSDWQGANYRVPVRVAKKTNGSSFTGMTPWDTAAGNNVRYLEFTVQAYAEPVVIPGIQRAINAQAGDSQVLSYVSEKMDEAREAMRDNLGIMFYGAGAGDDFDGLEVAVDDGTVATSYGGITRASYSWMTSTVDSTSTAITLALAFANFDAVSAAGDEEEAPTIGLTTKTLFRTLETAMNSQIQAHYVSTAISGYNKVSGRTPKGELVPTAELKGAAGFNAISLRGRPVVADDRAPSGKFYWLNENKLEFRSLKDDTLRQVTMKPQVDDVSGEFDSNPIQFRDMMKSINQHGEIGAFLLFGQFVNRAPRRQGKLINKT